ncbi:hypothetical protein M0805_008398 [Coniferiporia weirii]|nr:hypothetical protein M0805_008398 [Coniferiporia weirii]
MSQRPSTSKPRGVCKYFGSRRGCLNGDTCKFLHGEGETQSPYDKSKTCKFFAAGFCRRGDKCWFGHGGSTRATTQSEAGASASQSSSPSEGQDEEDSVCCICQEKPVTYGLLEGCSHICCLECLRGWRDPIGKSQDIVDSGNTKKCPYCRASSNFVTPSSVFYPSGDPLKAATIAQYKASMARVPCKYFERSVPGRRSCPFGRDCFYQHKEADGTPYVFPHGADYYMSMLRDRVRSRDMPLIDPFSFMRSFRAESNVIQTLSDLRTRLESLHLVPPNNESDDGNTGMNFISRLVDDVMSSLEDALVSSGSSVDDAAEVTHPPPGPSILATPEDTYVSPFTSRLSPLPLTRAFMDHHILSDERDDLDDGSMRELYEASRPEVHRRATRSSFTWRTDEGLEIANPGNRTPEDISDPFRFEDRTSDLPPRAESAPVRSSHGFLDGIDQPQIIYLDSDADSDPDLPDPEPVSEVRSITTSSEPRIPAGQEEVDESHTPQTAAVPPRDEDPIHRDHESRIKTDIHREPALRRAKTYSGTTPCPGRRSGGQSFVTDGRGRVVATDDGAVADPASLAFWGSAVPMAVTITSDESEGEVGSE